MSLIKELAKENLLNMALHGCRAVLQKELDIKQVVFSINETTKQELVRRFKGKQIAFPYSYITLNSIAAVKEHQNNFAVRKHGIRFHSIGESATTKKGYVFPTTLGLELHYVDSDHSRLLTMAQSLAILSLTNGLNFRIDVGDMYSFNVRMEIPLDTAITMQEEQSSALPGATDITAQLILHTRIGFFRDVSAVNGNRPILNVTLLKEGGDDEEFQFELPANE